MTLAVSGVVTPDLVRQTNMDATQNSRTSHSRVTVSMGEHIHRAELYFQSHKKAYAALELEHHQLGETRKKLVDTVSALDDQRTIAKRHVDALPPYDDKSHGAMNLEIVELDAGIASVKVDIDQIDLACRATAAQLAQVSEQLAYLQTIVVRDKYISSSETAPKVSDIKTVTAKVHELLPSIYETGSSVSGVSPRRGSPRRTPTPRAATPSSGNVNGMNWPAVVTSTYVACGDLGKHNALLRHKAEATAQQILVRCRSLRSQVLKQQTISIDSKVMQRQRILTDLDSLDGAIFDARHQWRVTSDAVQRMKEPLKTSSARHEVRETVGDYVGQALEVESGVLLKSRHELKKLCRALSNQVEDLEKERKRKQEELQSLDGQLRQDRAHCHMENPVGILARPHPIKVAAIRTYPHLLQSREIFGRSSSVSPRDNDGRSSSAASSTRSGDNIVASPVRLATPRTMNLPFESTGASLPQVSSPRSQAHRIPAPPRK
ncbi:unnamed protein product [Bodo saltans]|uniref:Uncharacterized protein n=1 Tax=Bodo saltans TaxID=75058 RepID=A0A0S4JX63_BODSA|nr:unnamed protein product [Bodo saltans]|eukprot:CUG94008.1 unnamed protein product [Bodo saltans]